MDNISLYIMAGIYILAGTAHFWKPRFYLKIMPPYLPYHLELVYLSGALEILLGILLLISETQQMAAWGIVALLVAVFPANIYMLTSNKSKKPLVKLILWLRLPLQVLLAYWAWIFT